MRSRPASFLSNARDVTNWFANQRLSVCLSLALFIFLWLSPSHAVCALKPARKQNLDGTVWVCVSPYISPTKAHVLFFSASPTGTLNHFSAPAVHACPGRHGERLTAPKAAFWPRRIPPRSTIQSHCVFSGTVQGPLGDYCKFTGTIGNRRTNSHLVHF